jgi:phenylacetate-CoA ligase
MLIIRGVNVFPTQIEEMVLKTPRMSPHYLIEVSRDGHLDEVTVKVELKPEYAGCSASDKQASVKELQHHIKSYVGISTRIDVVEVGGIERSVGKAKRVIDKRPKG